MQSACADAAAIEVALESISAAPSCLDGNTAFLFGSNEWNSGVTRLIPVGRLCVRVRHFHTCIGLAIAPSGAAGRISQHMGRGIPVEE